MLDDESPSVASATTAGALQARVQLQSASQQTAQSATQSQEQTQEQQQEQQRLRSCDCDECAGGAMIQTHAQTKAQTQTRAQVTTQEQAQLVAQAQVQTGAQAQAMSQEQAQVQQQTRATTRSMTATRTTLRLRPGRRPRSRRLRESVGDRQWRQARRRPPSVSNAGQEPEAGRQPGSKGADDVSRSGAEQRGRRCSARHPLVSSRPEPFGQRRAGIWKVWMNSITVRSSSAICVNPRMFDAPVVPLGKCVSVARSEVVEGDRANRQGDESLAPGPTRAFTLKHQDAPGIGGGRALAVRGPPWASTSPRAFNVEARS